MCTVKLVMLTFRRPNATPELATRPSVINGNLCWLSLVYGTRRQLRYNARLLLKGFLRANRMKFFSDLKAAIRRQWRLKYRDEMERTGQPIPSDFREQQPDDGDLDPPDANRVAARACCLAAVAVRGLASQWSHEQQQEFLPSLQRWYSDSGLDQEIEPAELEILQAPPSELDMHSAINACWRWEGAAVLAASLGRLPLPSHDKTVDTQACGEACGLLAPRADLHDVITTAAFDPDFDRVAYSNRVLAIHWRLRQFSHVEQTPLDFAAYARGVKWAKFDLRGVELCDGDLAIGGRAISDCDPGELQMTMSIASERHIAANWLIGWDPTYSDVENST
jgi:Domain of unknown function (DUF4272)